MMGKIIIAHWLTGSLPIGILNRQSYISKVLSRYLHSLTDNITSRAEMRKKTVDMAYKSVLFFSVRDATEEDSDLDRVFTLKTKEDSKPDRICDLYMSRTITIH